MNCETGKNPDQPNDAATREVIEYLANPPDGMSTADAAEDLCIRLDNFIHEYRKRVFTVVDASIRERGLYETRAELAASDRADADELDDLACAIADGLTFPEYVGYSSIAKWRFRDAQAEVARMRAENAARRETQDSAGGKALAPNGE